MIRFLFLSFLILCGCQKSTNSLSPSINIDGLSNFGNVLIGSQVYTNIQINNTTSDPIVPSFPSSPDFFITSSVPQSCSSTIIPANTFCTFKVIFAPMSVTTFTSVISFDGMSITLTGAGVLSNTLSVSAQGNSLNSILAGSLNSVILTIQNNNANGISVPSMTLPKDASLLNSNCLDVLYSNETCFLTIDWSPTNVSDLLTEYIHYVDSSGLTQVIPLTASVSPSNPSGPINLNMSSQLSMTNQKNSTVTIGPIKDSYGNIVSDNTTITVQTSNQMVASISGSDASGTLILNTIGGYASFQLTAQSEGNVTLIASTSYNFGSINLVVTN